MPLRCRPAILLLCVVLASPTVALAGDLKGTAKDRSGGALVGARVIVLTAQRAVVATATTDASGSFHVPGLADGEYVLIAQYPSLAERHASVKISGGTATIDLVLDVAELEQEVAVTASPGSVSDASRLTQPVNMITADDVLNRAKTVVAQVVEEETGVAVQRTGPGMAGVFVRGLTGNKVSVFVDGVRYSTGAQRGGVNTFLDLIDPSTLEGVEVLRGTSSAQYGSDALGGSVQFLTRAPALSATGEPRFSGTATAGGETAHPGGVGTLALGYSRSRFGITGSVSARKTGDYRPGGGDDSHAAVTRFFGVPSSALYPDRMPGTGFYQAAGQVRANWLFGSDLLLVANYLNSRQDGANRWDQTLGGDGNLVAELNDLQLDLFYARVESLAAGWFDRAAATYSLNTQREERVNQGGNGNPNAPIAHEPERTTVHGVQFNATKRLTSRQSLVLGGDVYFEAFSSDSFDENAVTGERSRRRPRVPDGATYRQGGVFAQTDVDLVPGRFTVTGAFRAGGSRYRARAGDAPLVNGAPLWPDDSLTTSSVTYRAGLAHTPAAEWVLTAAVSRGYRAPHMTDLGTLGLTGSGFEVAAPDLEGRSAFIGTTADASATSTGRPVEQVEPETSVNIEFGARYRTRRLRAFAGAFANRIDGNIQKQALILPSGAVGTTAGGEPIVEQTPDGAVFVAKTTVPVLVRANFDDARIWGVELDGEASPASRIAFGGTFTYLRAKDLATGLPPNIEGGTPAPGGVVWARYTQGNWWAQPYLVFAAEQEHLSSLDLGDRRTGAMRSRSNIQSFFRNGARARGWISPGADGTFGNADDTLIATEETLAQVQDRVLGPGIDNAPLFRSVPSYAVVGVRFGIRWGSHSVTVDAENLADENYRGISWGMDAPGRGVSARYSYRF